MRPEDKIVIVLTLFGFVSGIAIGWFAHVAWIAKQEIKSLHKRAEAPKKSDA